MDRPAADVDDGLAWGNGAQLEQALRGQQPTHMFRDARGFPDCGGDRAAAHLSLRF